MTGRATRGPRLAVLALLALARGRPVTRDRLVALVWPEAGPQRARAQLSDALYLIRGALGEDAVQGSGDDLLLNPAVVTSDVANFERLLEEGRLEEAVSLVVGPLLDGFHLRGAAELDHWLSRERAELADRHAAALASLAEASERAGDFPGAVRWWRRAAALDPGNGRATLRLMRALDAAGDRAGALRAARSHAGYLSREFDAGPDPDVVAFEERVRREPSARAPIGQAVLEVSLPGAAGPETLESVPKPTAGPVPPWTARRHWWWVATIPLAAMAIWWSGARWARPAAARVEGPPSVAVLPFANLSPDSGVAYFSDGLSEQVIAVLSRTGNLRVAARTSSFALRNEALGVRAIGDTLGVQTVLEGTVRLDGGRLRVTAQLTEAASGYALWSANYDREPGDVFLVQDEIARAIAGALEVRLVGRALADSARRPSLEAYDRYLRGLYLRNSLSGDALRQAAAHFDRAIVLEPDFALAYAGKASVIAPLIYFGEMPREEGVAALRALTSRALELDPGLGEAHVALGILKLFFEWDWPGAERALRRAVELNPNDAHAHHHLANWLHAMGRIDEAVAARERSVKLDPLNARTRSVIADDYRVAGQSERALEEYRRAFQLDPVNPLGLGLGPAVPNTSARVYLEQGRAEPAVEDLLRVALLRNAEAREIDAMRSAFAAGGMAGFWRAWLAMDLRQATGAPNTLRVAALHALAGDTTEAIAGLERALAEGNPGIIYLRTDFGLARLISHPRVEAVVRRLRFPTR